MTQSITIFHRNWLERREHVRLIAAAACDYGSGALLDVGCGVKPYYHLLAPHVERYVGLDLPPEWDIARAPLTTAQRSQATDVYGTALRLPFNTATFETVVSFQVLEHVPEPQVMIREAARVLRPGGYLLLSTPQMWHIHEAPHDYYRFTRYGLQYLCHTCGLDIIEMRSIAGFWARVGLKLTYRIDWLARGLRKINPKMNKLLLPLTAVVNIAFHGVDQLFGNDDSAVNFLVARKPMP